MGDRRYGESEKKEKELRGDPKIEKAEEKDLDAAADLYFRVTKKLEENINYPAWRSDLYPVRQTAVEALDDGGLYVLREGERIAASMILKTESEPEFEGIVWQIPAEDREMYLLCTLAVDPAYEGRGLGRAMVQFAVDLAVREGKKAIRLDVTQINEPAIRLYKSFGFQYVGTVDSGEAYEADFGERYFDLYEKVLEKVPPEKKE